MRSLLLTLPLLAALPAQAGWLDDSLSFDARLLPAIDQSRQAVAHPGRLPPGPHAVARLCDRWRAERDALQAALQPDPQAALTISRVGRQLGSACVHAETARWGETLRLLESIQAELAASRERTGRDYFLDRLTRYDAALRATLSSALRHGKGGSSQGRATTEQFFVEAMARWRELERMQSDLVHYPLKQGGLDTIHQAMRDESAALSRLSLALESGSDADIADAALTLSTPLSRIVESFSAPRRLRERAAAPASR